MTPNLIAGGAILLVVLTVIATRWLSSHRSAAVTKMENAVVEDGWKLLAKTVTAVADGSAKKQAVADANADLTEHFANVAKLKAAVAALPDA